MAQTGLSQEITWGTDCVFGAFSGSLAEAPRDLYLRLSLLQEQGFTPSDDISAYCGTVMGDILEYLSWMDYDLCYNNNELAYSCQATCGFCYAFRGSQVQRLRGA